MKIETMAQKTFDASHEDSGCGPYPHGHTFTVSARGPKDMEESLEVIVSELHLRDLGRMLNGGAQYPGALAAWFLERLIVTHPEIWSVTVSFMDRFAIAERERR
jgi:hypothetical protein